MSRITESQVGNAVLHILASRSNGRATVRVLKNEMPNYLALSAEDKVSSDTRTNEAIWEQQNVDGNIFHSGYVVSVGRGVWQITDAGRRRIAKAA